MTDAEPGYWFGDGLPPLFPEKRRRLRQFGCGGSVESSILKIR
jgi:hypothetical protein